MTLQTAQNSFKNLQTGPKDTYDCSALDPKRRLQIPKKAAGRTTSRVQRNHSKELGERPRDRQFKLNGRPKAGGLHDAEAQKVYDRTRWLRGTAVLIIPPEAEPTESI
jgi:hypothetical protein